MATDPNRCTQCGTVLIYLGLRRVWICPECLAEDREALQAAIEKHHRQRADDRCWMDDIELYAAAGLPPHDCQVGDTEAMLQNCQRFIAQRCQDGGPWVSYAELEKRLEAAEQERDRLRTLLDHVAGLHVAGHVDSVNMALHQWRQEREVADDGS